MYLFHYGFLTFFASWGHTAVCMAPQNELTHTMWLPQINKTKMVTSIWMGVLLLFLKCWLVSHFLAKRLLFLQTVYWKGTIIMWFNTFACHILAPLQRYLGHVNQYLFTYTHTTNLMLSKEKVANIFTMWNSQKMKREKG